MRLKKVVSVLLIVTMITSLSAIVSAGGSGQYITTSLSSYDSNDIGSCSVSSWTSTNYKLTVHSVGFNGIPPNTFPSNGLDMIIYDSGGVRVSRNFTSCTTKSGTFTPHNSTAYVAVENDNSIGVTACCSWKIG